MPTPTKFGVTDKCELTVGVTSPPNNTCTIFWAKWNEYWVEIRLILAKQITLISIELQFFKPRPVPFYKTHNLLYEIILPDETHVLIKCQIRLRFFNSEYHYWKIMQTQKKENYLDSDWWTIMPVTVEHPETATIEQLCHLSAVEQSCHWLLKNCFYLDLFYLQFFIVDK